MLLFNSPSFKWSIESKNVFFSNNSVLITSNAKIAFYHNPRFKSWINENDFLNPNKKGTIIK